MSDWSLGLSVSTGRDTYVLGMNDWSLGLSVSTGQDT